MQPVWSRMKANSMKLGQLPACAGPLQQLAHVICSGSETQRSRAAMSSHNSTVLRLMQAMKNKLKQTSIVTVLYELCWRPLPMIEYISSVHEARLVAEAF